ncbi:MAG: nitroreductase family protein, partial [Kordiimonas sp.]
RPDKASRYNSFDTGAAWAQLALQANALGYNAHAMAGVLFDEARTALQIPDRFKIEIAVAVGKKADADHLTIEMQEREQPSNRIPLADITFKGTFSS